MGNELLERINGSYTAPINVNVPTSIHPDQLSGHGETLIGIAPDAYSAGRAALKKMYESASNIDAAHTATLVTVPKVGLVRGKASSAPVYEKIVDPARAPELASSMAADFQRTAAGVDRFMQKIDGSIAALESKIAAATTHPTPDRSSVVQTSAEIRQFVKDMNPGERATWVQQQITAGDKDVAHAVLSSSCYTSGISKESHQILREFAREKFAPAETAAVKSIHAIKAKIDQAGRSYGQHYYDRLPSTRVSEADQAMAKLKGGAPA